MSFKISPGLTQSFKLSPKISDSFRKLGERSNSIKDLMKGAVPCLKATEAQVLDQESDEKGRPPSFWQRGAAGRYTGEAPGTPEDEDNFDALGALQSMPSAAPDIISKLSSVFLTDPGDFLKCEITGELAPSLLNILKYLMNEERHVLAFELLERMDKFLEGNPASGELLDPRTSEGLENVRAAFNKPGFSNKIELLRDRGPSFKRLFERENYSLEGWKLVSDYDGIKTYFRPGQGDKVLVRSEGELSVGLGDLIPILREGSYFQNWFPLCTKSEVLHLDGVEAITKMQVGVKHLFTREVVLHGYACDCTYADTLLFISKSINSHPTVKIPPPLVGWMAAGRLGIECAFRLQALSPNRTSTYLELELDPKMPGMESITNILVKKIGGFYLPAMQREGSKGARQGETWAIAPTVRESYDFYNSFACRKLRDLHDSKGWKSLGALPSVVNTERKDIPRTENPPSLNGKLRLDDSFLPRPAPIHPGKDSQAFWSCLL